MPEEKKINIEESKELWKALQFIGWLFTVWLLLFIWFSFNDITNERILEIKTNISNSQIIIDKKIEILNEEYRQLLLNR